ncbi:hypothetical protein [Paraburkholderia sp. 2C]
MNGEHDLLDKIVDIVEQRVESPAQVSVQMQRERIEKCAIGSAIVIQRSLEQRAKRMLDSVLLRSIDGRDHGVVFPAGRVEDNALVGAARGL